MRDRSATANPFPPVVIRGESITGESVEGEILIDTLSFTFPASALFELQEGAYQFNQLHSVWHLLDKFFKTRLPAIGVDIEEKVYGTRNLFDAHLRFLGGCGFVAFGGNNSFTNSAGDRDYVEERIQVYLSGEGCAAVSDFSLLKEQIESLGARITRLDIAFDDYSGTYSVDHCRALYASGEFAKGGRPPSYQYIENPEGCTFYVGKRANGKMLRCYEKGKQLGDMNDPWVRWETEFKNVDRELPLDMLLNPREYLAGSYPALSFIHDVVQVIKTVKKKTVMIYKDVLKHARRSYGKLLYFMSVGLGYTADEIVDRMMCRGSYPARLQYTHYAKELAA